MDKRENRCVWGRGWVEEVCGACVGVGACESEGGLGGAVAPPFLSKSLI